MRSAEVRTEPVRMNANIPVGARTQRTESQNLPKEEPQATNTRSRVQPRQMPVERRGDA